jgi:hypothetical protein
MALSRLYLDYVRPNFKVYALSFVGSCLFCIFLMWDFGVTGGILALAKICLFFSAPMALFCSAFWNCFRKSVPKE